MLKSVKFALLGATLVCAGCASVSPTVREHVPAGSDVAVITFRDCMITGHFSTPDSIIGKFAKRFRQSIAQ